jgi:hypothetical protein
MSLRSCPLLSRVPEGDHSLVPSKRTPNLTRIIDERGPCQRDLFHRSLRLSPPTPERTNSIQLVSVGGASMSIQYFKEQAIRAERLARSILDEPASEALIGLARDYWQKAGSLAGNPATYGQRKLRFRSPEARLVMTEHAKTSWPATDYKAPIVRNGSEGRELVTARWAMPSSSQTLMEVTKKRAAKLGSQGQARGLQGIAPDGARQRDHEHPEREKQTLDALARCRKLLRRCPPCTHRSARR